MRLGLLIGAVSCLATCVAQGLCYDNTECGKDQECLSYLDWWDYRLMEGGRLPAACKPLRKNWPAGACVLSADCSTGQYCFANAAFHEVLSKCRLATPDERKWIYAQQNYTLSPDLYPGGVVEALDKQS